MPKNVTEATTASGYPHSWICLRCGLNTAPGCLSAAQLADGFKSLRLKPNATEITIDDRCKVYAVKSSIWEIAGVEIGCMCIACLESRLGTMVMPRDFDRRHSCHSLPGTRRLIDRPYGQAAKHSIYNY